MAVTLIQVACYFPAYIFIKRQSLFATEFLVNVSVPAIELQFKAVTAVAYTVYTVTIQWHNWTVSAGILQSSAC